MVTRNKESPSWLKFSGVGVEFAAAIAGFALLGYWLDRRYGWSPWGLLVGVLLGMIGGTYNLIRQSLSAFKDAEDDERGKREG